MSDVHDRLQAFWDADAETYDRSPGHAVADPAEAEAWRAALLRNLPPPPADILDAGAGTGTMSLLAAELGYRVTALDLSPGMLARAEVKASDRGLPLTTVVGPADRPPRGPFDAVIERHLVWTLPDPVAALRAWREVAGRAVLLEGLWGRRGPLHGARSAATRALRRALRVPHDHHGEYDEELRSSLPLSRGMAPAPLVRAASEAGWHRYRIERLRDVERARLRSSPRVLGRLEAVPRFVLTLDR